MSALQNILLVAEIRRHKDFIYVTVCSGVVIAAESASALVPLLLATTTKCVIRLNKILLRVA